eukprot:746504-Hanusia_phi.AAC.18
MCGIRQGTFWPQYRKTPTSTSGASCRGEDGDQTDQVLAQEFGRVGFEGDRGSEVNKRQGPHDVTAILLLLLPVLLLIPRAVVEYSSSATKLT